ncbi:MAG TPA: N-acetylmuramoyl-L-alanine amidase [Thermoleophilaceae bacterium]|nr:N-acetylmuramoyl-L-alanine amidase [Thermoleophilaceae bacterium]
MEGMQRALVLTAAAVVAVLCLAAAPALSLKPYRPQPVDFSMAGGGVLGTPGPADGIVSEPLRAPKRFNLVGLTWETAADEPAADRSGHAGTSATDEPALAVRTRADGDDWTPWRAVYTHAEDGPDPGTDETTAVGMSNPVWAGEADWVQYRSSERMRKPQLHFVNTAGTATEADRALTAIRSTVSSAASSLAGVLRTRLAGAQEPQPAIVTRAAWGADDCRPRSGAAYGQVKAAYVHHTVSVNDYTREEAPQVVLGICRYHRNTNGWNDIGYNFLVDRFGTIYEGRAGGVGAAVIGAQALGFNAQSTGIANIGDFRSVPQSQAALDAMARLIRWKLPLHGYATSGTAVMQSEGSGSRYPAGTTVRVNRVLGHTDTNATECPGAALYAQIPQLRQMVAGVAPQGVATSVTATVNAPRATIDYGETVTVSGRLTRVDGLAAAGLPVQVQARVDGTWRTSSAPVTANDGSFTASVKPKLTRQLRVRFAGAGDLRSSVAPTTTVAVRPVVSITRAPRRGAAGLRTDLSGRVQPRKARVYQVLQLLRSGRRYRKVGARALPTRRGGYFDGSFVPARPGVFRFYLATKADALNARGASDKVVVRVRERARAQRGGARAR